MSMEKILLISLQDEMYDDLGYNSMLKVYYYNLHISIST